MAVTIQHLIQDQPPPITIHPSATLQEALARMVEHDFSQLPVLDGGSDAKPAHFVTANSIARAMRVFGTSLNALRVQDAVVPARTVSADEDLFSKMDELLEAYAVLVLDQDGTLAGIVTTYDTTLYFRRRAEDMLLVEDIETTLKDHVRSAYGGDESDPHGPLRIAITGLSTANDSLRDDCRKAFRRFCHQRNVTVTEAEVGEVIDARFSGKRGDREFDKLNLSEYIQLARRPEAWATLGPVFGVHEKAFLEMLEGVRETRNKLMHFRPDVDTLERDRLRFCAEWFKNHPPLALEADLTEDGGKGTAPDNGSQAPPADAIEYVDDSVADDDAGVSEGKSVESKYTPLAMYLASQPQSHERLTLTFTEVEGIIGASLPASAREHRAWWANDALAHVQSAQWLKVNWRVVSINMSLERVVFARARDRERAYINFFGAVQSRLRELQGFAIHDVNPIGLNWLPLVRYPEHGQTLVLSFARGQRLRLECYIDTGDAGENERMFELLQAHQTAIESALGPVAWERLEGRRACRIAIYTRGSILDDSQHRGALVEWVVEHAPRFDQALRTALYTSAQVS